MRSMSMSISNASVKQLENKNWMGTNISNFRCLSRFLCSSPFLITLSQSFGRSSCTFRTPFTFLFIVFFLLKPSQRRCILQIGEYIKRSGFAVNLKSWLEYLQGNIKHITEFLFYIVTFLIIVIITSECLYMWFCNDSVGHFE